MTVTAAETPSSASAQPENFLFADFLLTPSPLRLMHRRIPSRFRARFGLLLALLLTGTVLASPVHAQSSDAPTGTLTVQVDGLDSSEGMVRAELTTTQNYDEDGNIRAAALSIQDEGAQWTVEDVPHGTYAVRLYHDEDDDSELDTNMFGVPQEAFGFSNDARGSMGPPDFEEAAFTLNSDSLAMTVTVE
jgi:uncharacterized protein (DUF2141 family)